MRVKRIKKKSFELKDGYSSLYIISVALHKHQMSDDAFFSVNIYLSGGRFHNSRTVISSTGSYESAMYYYWVACSAIHNNDVRVELTRIGTGCTYLVCRKDGRALVVNQ